MLARHGSIDNRCPRAVGVVGRDTRRLVAPRPEKDENTPGTVRVKGRFQRPSRDTFDSGHRNTALGKYLCCYSRFSIWPQGGRVSITPRRSAMRG